MIYDWDALETHLREIFAGKTGKDGTLMVEHSLRVGREVRAQQWEPAVIFAAYTHDVLEDTDMFIERLMVLAMDILQDQDMAARAVYLAKEACYTEEEYALSKLDRKAAAVARWTAHTDPGVWGIKWHDVKDNEGRGMGVSETFYHDYCAWAVPFQQDLGRQLSKMFQTSYPVHV